MNIFGYDPQDREAFISYLRLTGYNNNGVEEIITRMNNNMPYLEDLNIFRRFRYAQQILSKGDTLKCNH